MAYQCVCVCVLYLFVIEFLLGAPIIQLSQADNKMCRYMFYVLNLVSLATFPELYLIQHTAKVWSDVFLYNAVKQVLL